MKSILNKFIFIITFIILLLTIIGSIIGIFIIKKASNTSFFINNSSNPIYIYDDNNNLVTTDSYYYTYVSITEISDNLINAVIATEDKNFYSHIGISIPRIISSTFTNLKEGKIISGASTITQQYVKNAYLTTEKSYERKINEIAISIELEKRYSKDQILEAYLNTVLFGGNIYGIEMASLYYFNKKPIDLTINESAVLAGMIQLPNYYNPFNNYEEVNKRKNIVLSRMLDEEYICTDEYNKYINQGVEEIINKGFINKHINYLSPYLDYLYQTIPRDQNKITKINTYLDTSIQQDLYNILSNEYNLFNDDKLNASIVVLDNKTYGIKAIAGNRNFNQRVLSYATDVKLQPGSTIKPILDYAPAIEYLNYNPATIIIDEPYKYKTGESLKNYDSKYLGPITLRKALSGSRNIPAVKLFNEVGYERAFSFASKLGIEIPSTIYEADSIGGATNGYTLLSLANAYQAFANLGYYKKSSPYKSITYDLKTIYNDTDPGLVMKPTTAFLINSILHDVFKNSTYNISSTYLMAKTGQTNYDKNTQKKYNIPSNATKDSLLIAYTKDITIGIWVGYNKIEKGQYLDYHKKNIPKNIMKILMDKYALKNQYYEIPDGIVREYITIHNNEAYLAKNNGYYEYFQNGSQPFSYPNYDIQI